MKRLRNLAVFTCVMLTSVTSFGWSLPLDRWEVTNGFWSCNHHCYHLGTDLSANPGDTVHAICEGRVAQALWKSECGNYGGRVLIQCDTAEGPIVVLYGHLGTNTDNPSTDDIWVREGDWVEEGQAIGRIGERRENGCWTPHLHLGINRGAWRPSGVYDCGKWWYAGYTARPYRSADTCYCQILDNWYDAAELLGMIPQHVQIMEHSVTPESGQQDSTRFRWQMQASRPFDLPMEAILYIYNPSLAREFPFEMRMDSMALGMGNFSFEKTLMNTGEYGYRFEATTCYRTYEEETLWSGPVVNDRCSANPETCNGEDDNCDGVTDEGCHCRAGELRNCGTDVGECSFGTQRCLADGRGWEEICRGGTGPARGDLCDGLDNDCDGETDEGVRNLCGTCGSSPLESCNGEDDNCDGRIDEGCECVSGDHRPCGPADVGICRSGNQFCIDGRWERCQSASYPREETCNGQDDDCDSETDESSSGSPIFRTCTLACGNAGTQTCQSGSWSSCSAEPCSLPPPSPPPSCECGTWIDVGCGLDDCGSSQMQRIRDCNPDACEFEMQCVYDASCGTPPPPSPTCTCGEWTNTGCAFGPCDAGLMQQIRSCTPDSCETETRCVEDASCVASPPPSDPPPPPEEPLAPEALVINSPSEEAIIEVPYGMPEIVTLRWSPALRAVRYQYEIGFTGQRPMRTGETTDTRFVFLSDGDSRAWQIEWKVKAIGATGLESDWTIRHFYFSDPIGNIVKCQEAACPVPGAYYLFTREIYRGETPNRLTIQWVRYECLAGRPYEITLYSYIRRYHRSASAGGCP